MTGTLTLDGTPPLVIPAGAAAGLAAISDASGNLSWGRPTGWLNVVTGYGADRTGAADSTTAIQAALTAAHTAGGGTVYFPAGTYKISSGLTVYAGTVLQGDGPAVSVISQTSTSADCLAGTDVSYVTVAGLSLAGPGSGSGNGIALGLASDSSTPYLDFSGLLIHGFGGNGVYIDTPIVSLFRRVTAQSTGGDGFFIHTSGSGGTSLQFASCYANGNGAYGFQLSSQSYSAMAGCAADSNTSGGYFLNGCKTVSLAGCGAEANSGAGFTFNGGSANSAASCSVSGNTSIAFNVTGSEAGLTLTGCREVSASGATAFIETASGCTAVVINPEQITGSSFATGTAYVITATGGVTH